MNLADGEGSTPTPQWAAGRSWWVGDEAKSDDGNPTHAQLSPSGGTSRRLSQFTSEVEAVTEAGRIQQRQQQQQQQQQQPQDVRERDPRRMFGDLPNSSLDQDLLGDPIQREQELRAAEDATVWRRPPHSDSGAAGGGDVRPAVSFAEMTRLPGEDEVGGDGRSQSFWKDECGRLQRQLASLARERERWEWDRRRLAEDADRARDLEGLQRAVEAQSQLVMENLVATQRLAATGAASASFREKGSTDMFLQYAWVQPSEAVVTTRDPGRREGGHNVSNTPSPRDVLMSPTERVKTNRVRGQHNRTGVWDGRNYDRILAGVRETSAAAAVSSRRSSATAAVAVGDTPRRRGSDGASQSRALQRSRHRGSNDPVVIGGNNSSSIIVSSSNSSRRSRSNNNNLNGRRVSSPSAVGPGSTSAEMVLAPNACDLVRRYVPQAAAGRSARSLTTYYAPTGWHRVHTSGNDDCDSGNAEEGKSEMWEWNGRRVVLQVSSPRQHLPVAAPGGQVDTVEQDGKSARPEEEVNSSAEAAESTAAGREADPEPTVVPTSLLGEIQEIKATIQALAAGAIGARGVLPQTSTEQAVDTSVPANATHHSPENPELRPHPPDTTPVRQQVSASSGVDRHLDDVPSPERREGSPEIAQNGAANMDAALANNDAPVSMSELTSASLDSGPGNGLGDTDGDKAKRPRRPSVGDPEGQHSEGITRRGRVVVPASVAEASLSRAEHEQEEGEQLPGLPERGRISGYSADYTPDLGKRGSADGDWNDANQGRAGFVVVTPAYPAGSDCIRHEETEPQADALEEATGDDTAAEQEPAESSKRERELKT